MDTSRFNSDLKKCTERMFAIARECRAEFATPEHLLLAFLEYGPFRESLDDLDADPDALREELTAAVAEDDRLPEGSTDEPADSYMLLFLVRQVLLQADFASVDTIGITHIVHRFFDLFDNRGAYLLSKAINGREADLITRLIFHSGDGGSTSGLFYEGEDDFFDGFEHGDEHSETSPDGWRALVTCLNDNLDGRNPLVGRTMELEETMRVLCRKEKNNVLHIGEAGVGKTAIVYGLARLIEDGRVPAPLAGARIYAVDLGSLLAGTQYRGDFEKRIKTIMDGVSGEPCPIVYIDEIHNLVGAGAVNSNSMDASNMLKPYLEAGKIRFIGSTTYDEYKRSFANSKGIVRRFRRIDIAEPSAEDTLKILNGLKAGFEQFHGVTYTAGALETAVHGSVRYMTDRRLPDKAIDLIDEAGAHRRLHPTDAAMPQTVDEALVSDILAKTCKVESVTVRDADAERMETLCPRVMSQIYGQDTAVTQAVEAVQMAKAGLTEANKPLASLLFVGPTGVGKTEVARVLAAEMGVELVRFDMSEYVEKHAVAKLIGAPAGYVGYEDGGQLVDAIRKTPECVLLLDEIEKAHPDIYNILLQVMDYARLTDNRGNRADFSNVVLIMTSNAGAQYAHLGKVGFGNRTGAGEAMMSQVKRTFKPEFLNRLSGTVVFNDMDRGMASLILDKKLRGLRGMLQTKNVELDLSEPAREYLLDEGFSAEYGARELDRVIGSRLKPLLMRAILFGALRGGGTAHVTLSDGNLSID